MATRSEDNVQKNNEWGLGTHLLYPLIRCIREHFITLCVLSCDRMRVYLV
jgi:hypothetical protein